MKDIDAIISDDDLDVALIKYFKSAGVEVY